MTKVISHADQRNAPEDIVLDESEVAPAEGATPEQIAKVLELSRDQFRLMKQVEQVAKDLKEAQSKLTANQMVLLPKAMKEAGLDECPLGEAGAKVELYTKITASIPSVNSKAERAAERNEAGIAYMDKRAPSMVSTVLSIEFPKGTEKELKKFLSDNARRKKPLDMELNRTVNTSSLGKWVREEIDAGRSVDEEALNVHRIEIAEVVLPKKKKNEVL